MNEVLEGKRATVGTHLLLGLKEAHASESVLLCIDRLGVEGTNIHAADLIIIIK